MSSGDQRGNPYGSPYDTVQTDDHDDSSTEVSETIDLNEKDYLHRERKKKTSWLAALKDYGWLVNAFLLLVVIVLQLDGGWHRHGRDHYFEGGGDLTGFAPEFPQQVIKFTPDPGFVPENTSEFFTKDTLDKWLGLVPRGLGYLEIKKPEEYDNLPKPLEEYPEKFVVTSSMTHQLHCLFAIAEAYSALSSNSSRVPEETPWHLTHCFDYLRQSIMCCGDVALEGQQTTFPDGFDGSDGWDAKHVCKDYSQVYEYLDRNRASDKSWI